MDEPKETNQTGLEIAVVGMAGRFPGARDIHEFWDNLKGGAESITFFTGEELEEAGIEPGILENPNYIKAGGILKDIEYFDAGFFGYTPKEAEIMDPQIRIFHECAWTALEDAGYDPLTYNGLIGVYAGAAPNIYWEARTILTGKSHEIGDFAAIQLSKKDYITLRLSYKLNLTGPSFVLYTACSTSLVAVHLACQGILNGESDMALAGGVTVLRMKKAGYIYQEDMINSPDGHCRAFDADAKGIIGGDGAGIVLLKRLEDALVDRDHIYALVKGSAVNNDGIRKAGFTAPSPEGQAEVIKMALQAAEVEPGTIGYIETHGTATPLGDPVEITGLKMAYNTAKKGFCGIGSVKTNVGHLDAAAGVTGFIKTVMILKHRYIPPTINFQRPNPQIDFIDSPFYVNTTLKKWENNGHPRRAGVSSFGVGGTNAHVILEEWPEVGRQKTEDRPKGETGGREHQLILLSAKTPTALGKMKENLQGYLKHNLLNQGLTLAGVAYTLQVGRAAFKHREMFVCDSIDELIQLLAGPGTHPGHPPGLPKENRPLVYLIPGAEQEAWPSYVSMAAGLYQTQPLYRQELEHCLGILQPLLGDEIKVGPGIGPGLLQPAAIHPVEIIPPLLFAIEYSLAKLLMHWGIKAYKMIGEGIGRAAADSLTGTCTIEEAIKMVVSGHGFDTAGYTPAIRQLSSLKDVIFLQLGPGKKPGKEEKAPRVNLVNHTQDSGAAVHFLIHAVGNLWQYGVTIDWQRFNTTATASRMPLPTYPFQRQRYWIEEDLLEIGTAMKKGKNDPRMSKNPDIAHWVYLPTWKRSILEPVLQEKGDTSANHLWLVFGSETDLGKRLEKELKQTNRQIVKVKPGQEFKQTGSQNTGIEYTINPRESRHYEELYKQMRERVGLPGKVLHLWNLASRQDPEDELTRETFDKTQWLGLYSMMYLAQTIGKQETGRDIEISLITSHLQEVVGGEPLSPARAPVLALLKAIPQEYPGINCRTIDILPPQPGSKKEKTLIQALIEEMTNPTLDPVIAYRNNQRWVPYYEPLPLGKHLEEKAEIPGQGVYLVTGGLGKIGLIFSELLVRNSKARLILTGRTQLPQPPQWKKWLQNHDETDPTSIKIKKLQELEKIGGEVHYIKADVADQRQMRDVVTRAEKIFGQINGVIHAAGITSGQSMRTIRELTREDCQLQFQTKVYGLLVLEELFKNRQLDFFQVMSSVSCVLAGLGFGAYASANIFMDVYLKKHNQLHDTRWLSLNWDVMEAEKSLALFKRLFAIKKVDRVVASEGGNLQARIDRWIKLEPVRKKEEPGKKEKKTPGYPRPDLSTPYAAPRSEIEETIAIIWKNLFGFDKIGIHDDYLELGGDSLKSITIISRIHRELHVNIPLTEYFSRPTIRELAQYITSSEDKSTYKSIEPAEKKEFYPVSSAQKRIYIIHRMTADSKSYNLPTVVNINGEFHPERLKRTFKQLIERHDGLRTSFTILKETPIQVIHDQVECEIEYSETKKQADMITKKFIRPFDLARAPLMRMGLIKTGEAQYIFIVDMYHIISDAISYQILVNDFMALYNGAELTPLKIQYKDFSQWENRLIEGGNMEKQKEFWTGIFKGDKVTAPNMPWDYPRPPVRNVDAGDDIVFGLQSEISKKLRQVVKKAEATLFMVLLAAYNILLAKYTKQEDIVVGTLVTGRSHVDLADILGVFVNTIPLRNAPKKDKTFKEFLKEIKENTLRAFENQDYSFDELVVELGLQGDPSRNPLFDTVFTMNIFDFSEIDTGRGGEGAAKESDMTYNILGAGNKFAKFDLYFEIRDQKDTIIVLMRYSTQLFKPSTIKKIGEFYTEILEQVVENIDIKLKDITLSHGFLTTKSTVQREEGDDFNF